jgi:3-phosphoshikimate 1-carboxyvinyltransferase
LKVTVHPSGRLKGAITAPPSKAQTHRALVAGFLSKGVTKITNPLVCDDTNATAAAIMALGAAVAREGASWAVESDGRPSAPKNDIQCGESGVTLRFMIPIVSLTGSTATLRASRSLMRRPNEPLVQAMYQLGISVSTDEERLTVSRGPPDGGHITIRGDISSQFISGLLFAAPFMRKGLSLEVTHRLESKKYVSMTIATMKAHGVDVKLNAECSWLEVAPGQNYVPADHIVGGDFSSAAFPLSAAAVTGSDIVVHGLSDVEDEPDGVIVRILKQMGADAHVTENSVAVNGSKLKATNVDIRDSPDLGPIVAVLGCYAEGETKISGAQRLRFKESDRLAAISTELSSLGAKITQASDGLIIQGVGSLKGGLIHSHNDHRIVMALTVAALRAQDEVVIEGAECVKKSYPQFFDDLRSLGVEVLG